MLVFAKVVETRSFTVASEELGVGKARVSQIVSKLEQDLNTRLLNRTTRSLSLTDSGLNYYQKCSAIQELVTQANAEVQDVTDEPSGSIRISVPVSNHVLIQLLSKFISKYPLIHLDIIESDSNTNLVESRCDIAIRSSSTLEDSNLYAVKIGEFRDILCASSKYLSRFHKIESVQQLLELDWISHKIAHGDKLLKLTSPNGKVIKLPKTPKITVSSGVSLKNFIINDIGFGVIPSFSVVDELANGQLVRILPDAHELIIPVYAVYQNKTLMPRRIRTLIEFLKTEGKVIG